MRYETHTPTKEIYLPMNYKFINDHDQNTFKEFAKDYKNEYGIDLHDLFDLKLKSNNEYYIVFKTTYKLFAYSISDDTFQSIKNMVAFAIHDIEYSKIPESGTTPILNIGCGLAHNLGYGFKITLPNSMPNSIDDLFVELLEY